VHNCAKNCFKIKSKRKKTFAAAKVFFLSILGVADIAGLCGIKGQIADRGNQTINAKGNVGQKKVSQRAAGITCGLQRRMINDNAADPAKEEGQQKTNELLVLHNENSFDENFLCSV
jgi:hypothetical protein